MTDNVQQPPATVQKFQESTVDSVLTRIAAFQTTGDLKLPLNYSAENAVRSAWLIIQGVVDLDKRPALEVCTRESIANALLDMVLQGLNPVKKQCYFIVYGNKLTLQKSYMGTITISKRLAGVKDVKGIPVYAKDVFKYTRDLRTGVVTVTQHDQEFDNIDPQNVKGAYAIVTYNDDHIEYEVMTMPQIRACWELGKAKGNSLAHKAFADEMACKTVINRALKIPVNTTDDADLYADVKGEQVQADVKLQIAEHGNKDEIGFDDEEQAAPIPTVNIITPEPVPVTTATQEEPTQQQQAQGVQQKVPF